MKYTSPEIEMVELETIDVISASIPGDDPDTGGETPGGDLDPSEDGLPYG